MLYIYIYYIYLYIYFYFNPAVECTSFPWHIIDGFIPGCSVILWLWNSPIE